MLDMNLFGLLVRDELLVVELVSIVGALEGGAGEQDNAAGGA